MTSKTSPGTYAWFVVALLAGERNCGGKTMDEIARWISQGSEAGVEAAVATASQAA